MKFKRKVTSSDIVLYEGSPDCQAAHDAVVERIKKEHGENLLPMSAPLTKRRQGNIGEYITLNVCREQEYKDHHEFPQGAYNPLSDIAKDGVDIVWVYLGASKSDDYLVIQEIKTTGVSSLAICSSLVTDYKKLFSTDPRFTLHTRIQSVQAELRYKFDDDSAANRLNGIVGRTAAKTPKVKICPTLVHEKKNSKPEEKLKSVRDEIVKLGWDIDNINPISISLTGLKKRLKLIQAGLKS